MSHGEFTRAAGRPSAFAGARRRLQDVSPTRAACACDRPPPGALRRAGALHRRVVKKGLAIDGWDDYYYNSAWQVLEVRRDTTQGQQAPVLRHQYVWSVRYIDAPVLRDENKDADGDCTDGDDERLYFCNDVNMNVVALVNDSNEVVERYRYDPYGRTSVLHGVKDAAGTDTSASEWNFRGPNKFDNELGFCGYWYDFRNGFYHVRHRAYYPNRGWLQRDPLGYVDGMSLYEYVESSPTLVLDPFGLQSTRTRDFDVHPAPPHRPDESPCPIAETTVPGEETLVLPAPAAPPEVVEVMDLTSYRYVTTQGVHTSLHVAVWNDDATAILGYSKWDFSGWNFPHGEIHGLDSILDPAPPENWSMRVRSSWAQDVAILDLLTAEYDAPPYYTLIPWNCWTWAVLRAWGLDWMIHPDSLGVEFNAWFRHQDRRRKQIAGQRLAKQRADWDKKLRKWKEERRKEWRERQRRQREIEARQRLREFDEQEKKRAKLGEVFSIDKMWD